MQLIKMTKHWLYMLLKANCLQKNIDKKEKTDIKTSMKYINKPGIALTFDDGYRAVHWYKYGFGHEEGFSDIFDLFNVRATFCTNAIHSFENHRELNQNEIDMLIEIQSKGHEIAHHGYGHKNAVDYVAQNGIDKWLKDEILSLFEWMQKQRHSLTGEAFKKPVCYIYPYSEYNETTNNLLSKYFKLYRGGIHGTGLAGFEHTGLCSSWGIDKFLFPYITSIGALLRHAKKNKQNIVFMCHSILPETTKWSEFGWGKESIGDGNFRISPESLIYLMAKAKKLGLEFYTLSEIAGIATFQDHNFEGYVRKLINKPNELIYIRDLTSIKELDLSNIVIRNFSGIEYFVNLERLKLPANSDNNEKIQKMINNPGIKIDNINII